MQRVPLDRLIVSHNQEDQRIHPYYDGMVTEEHGLPLDVYYEIIWKKRLGFSNWHWHEKIQILLAIQGDMAVMLTDQKFELHPGEGLIMNAGQLHRVIPRQQKSGILVCLNLGPSALGLRSGSYMDRNFVEPYTKNPEFTAVHLHPLIPWCKKLMDEVQGAYLIKRGGETAYEVDLMSVMYRIWSLFIKNVTFTKAKKSTSARHQSITKTLMGFIKAHYHENFAITDLAAFTSYSGSECCRIFKETVHETIYQFLNKYRLEKAAVLLRNTELPVSAVAQRTGFSSTSYFIKCFKLQTMRTPLQFRKELHK